MSVYSEVLKWSQARPLWQRDALRRLVSGPLSEDDIRELARLCRGAHVPDGVGGGTPIAEHHLPLQGSAAATTTLSKVHDVQNVGALVGQQVLEFAATGVTIVYGDNGSGKSSYARILKRACRARGGQEPVEPNVFAHGDGRSSARLDFAVGGSPFSAQWVEQANVRLPDALSQVWVFDSAAATVYVGNKTDVVARPAGLDLLTSLANACERVRNAIQLDLTHATERANTIIKVAEGSAAANFVKSLSALTSPEAVDQHAQISPEEIARAGVLATDLARLEAEDPRRAAAQISARATRVKALHDRLARLNTSLGDDVRSELVALRLSIKGKEEAVSLASGRAFKDEALPSVGAAAWRALWEAARSYSAIAYPNQTFPVIDAGAHCLLCQQELVPVASERLQRFEAFVRNTVETELEVLRTSLRAKVAHISTLPLRQPDDVVLLDELRDGHVDVVNSILLFLDAATARATHFTTGSDSAEAVLPTPPTAVLLQMIAGWEARSRELETQHVPEVRLRLARELNELRGREQLAAMKAQALDVVRSLKLADALKKAVTDTDTTPITRKSSELTKQAVTDALVTEFATECSEIAPDALRIQLKAAGGAKGVLYHQVELQGSQRKVTAPAILSEGEQRAVALAAFLSEVKTHPAKSAIVFDDPVSSFDHIRRARVADRLAREGGVRQVIVFTHDAVFMMMLAHAAERHDVPTKVQWVERTGTAAGYCQPGVPWIGQKVKERIGVLKQRAQKAAQLFRSEERSVYEAYAKDTYGALRETWERAVEEVLFNLTVERLRLSVETQRLRQLSVLDADVERIERGMSKSSRWLRGHDAPTAVNAPVPDPAELLADVTELDLWVAEVRGRQNKKKGT